MLRALTVLLCALIVVLLLSACGGGTSVPLVEDPELEQPHDYSRPGYVRPTYPYLTGSTRGVGINSVLIGLDAEPKDRIGALFPSSATNGLEVSMGPSRDGVGLGRLLDYRISLGEPPTPFKVRPRIWFEDVPGCGFECIPRSYQLLYLGVAVLNDVLPPEFQIELAGTFSSSYEYNRLYNREGNIAVLLGTESQVDLYCGITAAACASMKRFTATDHMFASRVILPEEIETMGEQAAMTLIMHELLHALGIRSHVNSIQFPDSIMGTSGDFFPSIPFVLHRIDAEFLQSIYMSQNTNNYNHWGDWSDTALHLVGRYEDGMVNFGTALFNGLPQPWARGVMPDTDLKDNSLLRGSATWKGPLLGFSGVSPIMGGASLRVNLRTLKGDLEFRNIIFANRLDAVSYFPVRNIDYDVEIASNGFWNTSGEGFVTGSFMGPKHEGMGGTVKRTDLVGAFGGKRGGVQSGPPEPPPPPPPPPPEPPTSSAWTLDTTGRHIGHNFRKWGFWAHQGSETLFRTTLDGDWPLIRVVSEGTPTGSNPTFGSAVWRGHVTAYRFGRPTTSGDARLEMNLAAATIDVDFTNFTGGYRDMSWDDLSVVNGVFRESRGTFLDPDTIEGKFYGDQHQGVAGKFERDGTEGVFGALRK